MFSPINKEEELINRSIEVPEQKVGNDLDKLNFGGLPFPGNLSSAEKPKPKSTQIELASTKRYAVQVSDGVYIVEWDTGGGPHEITTDLELVNFTKFYPDIKRAYPNAKVLRMTETITVRGVLDPKSALSSEPTDWNVGEAF